jgi:hypothetical protein
MVGETCLTRPHHVMLLPREGRPQVEPESLAVHFRLRFNSQIKGKRKESRTVLRTLQLSQPYSVSLRL